MGMRWFTGLVVLVIAAIALSLLGPWAPMKKAEQMGAQISNDLSAAGLGFASVDMDGRVARLTGTTPSDSAAEQAMQVAQNARLAEREGEEVAWHKVTGDFDMQILETVSPYVLKATKSEDGSFILGGYVETEADRDDILGQAETLFEAQTRDMDLNIALGAPNTAWTEMIKIGLGELTNMPSGQVELRNNQMVITGQVADIAARDRINARLQNLPEGYTGATNISVPDAAAENLGEIQSGSVCQGLIDALKVNNSINFASGKAEIQGAESFDLLNNLADVAKQCSAFAIEVAGHTDSTGNAEANLQLSQDRASAVVTYLADNGVDVARMQAIGYGETRPVADNSAAEGRAQNRRIEFIVSQSE